MIQLIIVRSLLIILYCTVISGALFGQQNVTDNLVSNVIQIDQGRQLFVIDHLIASTTLKKVFHKPLYDQANPIIKADRKWELNANGDPYAAPFSGGVWYDEKAGKYKMWYSAGGGKIHGLITCYAESVDGKQWSKPALDVVAGTNIVDTTEHDCVSVLLDKFETDPQKKYKMFVVTFNKEASVSMKLKYSADGIHWGKVQALSGELYDRCAAYYDPFKKEYVLSLKTLEKGRRSRNYMSNKDPELLVSLAHRTYINSEDPNIRYWFGADEDDPRNPDFPGIKPQIYNHEAMPYESLSLGYFTIWQGPDNDACDSLQIEKRNEVLTGWANDGYHWVRDHKEPFFPVSKDPKAWNAGNIQSSNGNPLIVGDSLFFYMSGRYFNGEWDSNFSTGLATLRRDGFVSMQTNRSGYLITHDLAFTGDYFFVNADIKGILKVELQDLDGKPLKGYSIQDCIPMKVNSTKYLITWKNKKDLTELRNRPVKVKFYLEHGALYSFWISKWKTGESNGYTAGGGPGLNSGGVDAP